MKTLDPELDKQQIDIGLYECLQFVRQHGLLSRWGDLQILESMSLAIKEDAFAFMRRPDGSLSAIVWGRNTSEDRHGSCLHIVCIAGFSGCLVGFVKHLQERLPFIKTLTAQRNGVLVKYDLQDLNRIL